MNTPPRPYSTLYVHVPFCRSKCGYCAFYSVEGHDAASRGVYVDTAIAELRTHADACGPIESVYIGGGTPSCLETDRLGRLLDAIRTAVRLAENGEWSLECNPGSLTARKAEAVAQAGVNRVSLGVQSFRRDMLRTLRRQADPADVAPALESLRAAGIRNVGVDLIYGIPGQTPAAWREEVRHACDLGVDHLSTYELTWEEGTRLAPQGRPVEPDTAVEMWHAAAEVASAYGLRRYEVSNLAREDRRCRHHDAVWHGATYLGVGPAAVSFDGRDRRANPADLCAWLAGGPAEVDALPPATRAAEVLAFGLRTVRGWTRRQFQRATACDYVALRGEVLARLAGEGFLALDARSCRPTERGLLFADHVAAALL
jgi:oxygen-independent coproporphyrinogen-3 oxidase